MTNLYPYEYVDSVFSIDYNALYEQGIRGLIFDIDNTLVHHGDDSTPEIDQLFRDIQAIGFKTLLLSNNEEKRINRFVENITTYYICDAEKPKTWGYLKALEIMELEKKQVVVIGDQIFTDVLGANRAKLASILVKFIRLPEETKIGKRRRLEQVVLATYYCCPKYKNRLGGIAIQNKATKQRRRFSDMNPIFYHLAV